MCCGCWKEHGSPIVINEEVMAAWRLVVELYETHLAGGALHIVTDDFNIEQHSIDWCMAEMEKPLPEYRKNEPYTDIERRCGAALQVLTDEERATVMAIEDGCIDTQGNVRC